MSVLERFVRALLLSIVVGAAATCTSNPSGEEIATQVIVATKYDTKVNFASFSTFAVTQTIPIVSAISDAGPALADAGTGSSVDPSVANPIFAEITTELTGRGYRAVDRTQHPDLGVNVVLLDQQKSQTVSTGAWWGVGAGVPTYWAPTTGAIYAPWSYSTVSWSSGTLIIEIYNLRDSGLYTSPLVVGDAGAVNLAGARVEDTWAAFIHGVLGPANATLTAPPIAQIQQAFAQSPYLAR